MTLEAHPGHSLAAHLRDVGNMAAKFARYFGGEDHARLAGLLHDLGKAEEEFQQRLRHAANPQEKDGKKQPHAHHGAALVLEKDDKRGGPVLPVAFAINGHHAGLHDRSDVQDVQKRVGIRKQALEAERRLTNNAHWNGTDWPVKQFGQNLPEWLERLRFSTPAEREAKIRAVDLYTRFLFSALIDADRLDAERNDKETKDNFAKRHGWRPFDAVTLLRQLNEHIERKRAEAKSKADPTVCAVRDAVLAQCRAKAKLERGVFTLTVPTGGGKTLASLAFALEHAKHHNRYLDRDGNPTGDPTQVWRYPIRRVIIVIPYLSIIQQTARELQEAFRHSDDDPVVLEHHSQAQDPEIKTSDANRDADCYSRERTMRQLAAENWDAPIVVTTSVQFFDSLFSRRPADARKLHNIAQSVIIFDEVQTFPPRLMQPILDVLGELARSQRSYGCSLVFCTATQPALRYDEADLRWGLKDVREIVEKPVEHFQVLQRTTYQWPIKDAQGKEKPLSWDDLADEVLHEALGRQALVVVNTRRHARELFEAVREKIVGKESGERPEHLFHLSTWMTPAHRVAVLDEVKERLEAKRPCLLISTQCIEAGVNVDFPAVWRAFGPYDAIVQAAGRCNRNGALKDAAGQPIKGVVRVFRPESDGLPTGVYQTATSQTELLRKIGVANPHDPTSFETYFRLLYQLSVPDECEIQKDRAQLRFKKVSDRFQFIEAFAAPLLIARERPAGDKVDQPVFMEINGQRIKIDEFVKQARRKGYLSPIEWHQLQSDIVNLDFRDRQTPSFLGNNANRVFKDDDPLRGLYVLNVSLYEGGFNGCGLDILKQDFSRFSIL